MLPFLFDFAGSKSGSIVLALSPLVSLMVDQVQRLRKCGVSAAILTGNKGIEERLVATDEGIKEEKFSLLFSVPEAISGSDKWRLTMQRPCLR